MRSRVPRPPPAAWLRSPLRLFLLHPARGVSGPCIPLLNSSESHLRPVLPLWPVVPETGPPPHVSEALAGWSLSLGSCLQTPPLPQPPLVSLALCPPQHPPGHFLMPSPPTTHLNKAFKFSGSSVRPAYPGFMVMKRPTVGMRLIISPRKLNVFFLARIASWIHFT